MEEGMKIDFSALAKLQLPEIPFDKSTEDSETKSEVDTEAAKEAAIMEVNSIEEFEKGISKDSSNDSDSDSDPEESKDISEDSLEESPIKLFSTWAKEKGIIEYSDEEFQDSEDFIASKLEEKTVKLNNKYKEELPPIIKELIENYEEGVPLDALIYSKSREIEYGQLEESNIVSDINMQKKLVADWLSTQDFTDKEISKRLEKLEDAALLEDEALTAWNKLQKFEQNYQEEIKQRTKQQQEESKKLQAQRLDQIKTEMLNMEEFIPGVKRSKAERERAYEAYTKLDRTGKTEFVKKIENDPKAWYKMVDFMVLMDGNVNNLKKIMNTEASRRLKETVNTYQENTGTSKLTSPAALKTIKKALEATQRSKNT